MKAAGGFTVKMAPEAWADGTSEHGFGRFQMDKQYHGELEAAGTGQMLSFGDGKAGSSGVYVAIEKVAGTLGGKQGSFVLYHTGVMTKGAPSLTILVAPDSGTGELAGLTGSLTITIADGKHGYEFMYSLP